MNKNLEMLEETSSFETIDSYLPYFCEKTETLFDYFKNYFFIMDNVQRCEGKLDSTYLEFEQNFTAFSSRGDIFPKQGQLLIGKDEVFELFSERNIAILESLEKNSSWLRPFSKFDISGVTLNNYQLILLLVWDITLASSFLFFILV